jgi:hypothetical protein
MAHVRDVSSPPVLCDLIQANQAACIAGELLAILYGRLKSHNSTGAPKEVTCEDTPSE